MGRRLWVAGATAAIATVAGVLLIASTTTAGPHPVHSPSVVTDDVGIAALHCHAGVAPNGGPLPDPKCTPGGYDPAVTQATIGQTICVSGWTATVRPPSSVTRTWSDRTRTAYGTAGPAEYDHLIPLELGGANSTSNLWPQPGPIPNQKDAYESALKRRVCAGTMTLTEARNRIATDWTTALSH